MHASESHDQGIRVSLMVLGGTVCLPTNAPFMLHVIGPLTQHNELLYRACREPGTCNPAAPHDARLI